MEIFVYALLTLLLQGAELEQGPQILQASPKQQQNKTDRKASEGDKPQQAPSPAEVTVKGPITVIDQPNSNEQQREADQKAQTHFSNSVQVATLILTAIAVIGAIGAFFASWRQAESAKQQITLLKNQIKAGEAESIEQRRISTESLSETRKSAEAAIRNADAVTRALIMNQRAYLEVTNFRSEFWIRDDDGTRLAFFHFSIFNRGNAAARIDAVKTALDVAPGADRTMNLDYYTLPSGARIEQGFHLAIPMDEHGHRIVASQAQVTIEIDYKDIFRKRSQNFAFSSPGVLNIPKQDWKIAYGPGLNTDTEHNS